MVPDLNTLAIRYAPTETADLYPELDGKPMAETDLIEINRRKGLN